MQEDDSQGERECPGDGRGDRLAAHVVDRHQRKRQNPGGNATQQQERPECEQVGDVRMEKAVDRRARHPDGAAGQQPDGKNRDGALAQKIVCRGTVSTCQHLRQITEQALVLAKGGQQCDVHQHAKDERVAAVFVSRELADQERPQGERRNRTGGPPGNRPADEGRRAIRQPGDLTARIDRRHGLAGL